MNFFLLSSFALHFWGGFFVFGVKKSVFFHCIFQCSCAECRENHQIHIYHLIKYTKEDKLQMLFWFQYLFLRIFLLLVFLLFPMFTFHSHRNWNHTIFQFVIHFNNRPTNHKWESSFRAAFNHSIYGEIGCDECYVLHASVRKNNRHWRKKSFFPDYIINKLGCCVRSRSHFLVGFSIICSFFYLFRSFGGGLWSLWFFLVLSLLLARFFFFFFFYLFVFLLLSFSCSLYLFFSPFLSLSLAHSLALLFESEKNSDQHRKREGERESERLKKTDKKQERERKRKRVKKEEKRKKERASERKWTQTERAALRSLISKRGNNTNTNPIHMQRTMTKRLTGLNRWYTRLQKC